MGAFVPYDPAIMSQPRRKVKTVRDLVPPDLEVIQLKATDKTEAIRELLSTLVAQDVIDLAREREIREAIIQREQVASTGIGNGVALPHGRINGLDNVIGAVAVLATPLDYDSLDNDPVNLAFGLLVPADANEQHLKILAYLARLFSDTGLRQELITAKSNLEVYELLTGWVG